MSHPNGAYRRINWAFEIAKRIKLCVQIVFIFLVLGLFAEKFWWLDLLTHFRIQYAFCLLVAAIVLYFLNERRWAAVSGCCSLMLAVWTYPYWLPYQQPREGDYTIMAYNLRTANQQYEKVTDYLREVKADMVLVIEINEEWNNQLESLGDFYPHQVSGSREDNFGIMLLSRFKILESEIRSFGELPIPTIVAKVDIEGDEILHVVGTHPPPPMGKEQSELRNRQLREIAEYCASLNGHYVVAGDLNITPFSPHYSTFLTQSDLVESGRGWGWQPTWFSKMPWFAIPIDHILFSYGVEVTQRKIGPTMGSDHNPVVISFNLIPD